MTEKRLAWDEYFATQALLIANQGQSIVLIMTV